MEKWESKPCLNRKEQAQGRAHLLKRDALHWLAWVGMSLERAIQWEKPMRKASSSQKSTYFLKIDVFLGRCVPFMEKCTPLMAKNPIWVLKTQSFLFADLESFRNNSSWLCSLTEHVSDMFLTCFHVFMSCRILHFIQFFWSFFWVFRVIINFEDK